MYCLLPLFFISYLAGPRPILATDEEMALHSSNDNHCTLSDLTQASSATS